MVIAISMGDYWTNWLFNKPAIPCSYAALIKELKMGIP
jgi:hypothetical protein